MEGLLKKYLEHVIEKTGGDLLTEPLGISAGHSEVNFSDEELAILNRLSEEIRAKHISWSESADFAGVREILDGLKEIEIDLTCTDQSEKFIGAVIEISGRLYKAASARPVGEYQTEVIWEDITEDLL